MNEVNLLLIETKIGKTQCHGMAVGVGYLGYDYKYVEWSSVKINC